MRPRWIWTLFAAGLITTAGVAAVLGGTFAFTSQSEPIAAQTASPAPFVSPPSFSVEDALGDAYDGGADRLSLGAGCHAGCIYLPAPLHDGVVEASWLDVVQASFLEETPESIRLAVTIDHLPADMAMLEATPGIARYAMYGVCWNPAPDAAGRCVQAHLSVNHGEVQTVGTFHLYSEACNSWAQCIWYAPAQVLHGSPGRVVFDVPKAYLDFDGAPLAIAELTGFSATYMIQSTWPGWHQATSFGLAGNHGHKHAGIILPEDRADVSETSEAVVKLTPSQAGWPSTQGPVTVAEHGNVWGKDGLYDDPEMDLLSVDIHEEGPETVVTYTLGAWGDEPLYTYHYDTLLGLPGQERYELGVRKDTGDTAPYGYVGQCIGFPCHDRWIERFDVQALSGSPGQLVIRFPTELLGEDLEGTPTTELITVTMRSEVSAMVGYAGDDPQLEVHTMAEPDFHIGSWPYVFGSGHRATIEDGHGHGHR